MSEHETTSADFRIPRAIRVILFGLHALIALRLLGALDGADALVVIPLFLLANLVIIPLAMVAVGWLLKQLDPTFRLENAYYLGLFIAFVLSTQGIADGYVPLHW
jgi:ACR3 family arsenite efflux pump ArsB